MKNFNKQNLNIRKPNFINALYIYKILKYYIK